MSPEEVARHQKARLRGAMVEAVARYGYGGTTLRELVRLAGVSKSTFYQRFDSKQACFLATFDEIIARVTERVTAAYREGGDFREKLDAALTQLMDLVVSEPAAANLAAVESLTLGAAGVAPRERGFEAFEAMIRESFEQSPSPQEVSAPTVRAIAAGIRGIVSRHLRAGRVAELPKLVPDIVEWALSYQEPDGDGVRRAQAAAEEPRPESRRSKPELDWKEPPDSPRSRAELTQRERILRATGQLVVSNGYDTLSIPAISGRAGTSNQTFYEHFNSKRDAFIAAFDVTAAEGLRVTTEAFESATNRAEAVGSGMRAVLEHIASDELFARLTFFDLQTAGPVALDRADAALDSFIALLQNEARNRRSREPASKALLQAVGSGVWSVIQHELALGEATSLPNLAPELARILLVPFSRD
jgi:AcrR family transcriptional regulator